MTPASDRDKKAGTKDPSSSKNTPEGERIRPHVGAARDGTRAAPGSPVRAAEKPSVLKVASPLSDFAGFFDTELGSETLRAKAQPATRPARATEVKAKAEATATRPSAPSATTPPATRPAAPTSTPPARKETPGPVVKAHEMDVALLSKNVPLIATQTPTKTHAKETVASTPAKPSAVAPQPQREPLVDFIAAPPPAGPSPARPDITPSVPTPFAAAREPTEPVWEIAYPQGALLLGNISAKGGVLIGPSALMNGSIRTDGPIAIGDHAEVTGRIDARGPITIGVGADLGPVRSTRGLSAAPSEGVELKAMRHQAVPLGPQTAIEARYVARQDPPFGGRT